VFHELIAKHHGIKSLRIPKPQVACSIHAGGTNEIRVLDSP